jgi:hypothetical protein
LGRYGWLMRVAFVTFGVAHLALIADMRRYLCGPGRVGSLWLRVSSAPRS